MRSTQLLMLAVTLLAPVGCRVGDESAESPDLSTAVTRTDPCAVALTPHKGTSPEDTEIELLQERAREASDPARALERLGWRFVAKARVSYDPGYYKLAEQSALCLEARKPESPEALLLRGHVLHNLHRFAEMETLARRLVAARGNAFDHGLLGDALMEQGKLDESIQAYQTMVDLKPGLQAYSRAAHVRWLKGDLRGALGLMRMAATAGSPRNGESAAWAYSRLALYELQAGSVKNALDACDAALGLQTDYAPALLARGQILLAEGKIAEAVAPLRRAAELNPLPEFKWTLADALRAAGRVKEASAVEAQLEKEGAASDPRTFALYLATRGEQVETALRLAQEEIGARADVLTLDVLAWSQAAAGRTQEARASMERALRQGTKDARLFYHAGVIAAMAGQEDEARRWLDKAAAIRQMLLPYERERLLEQLASL
jgi:tetratricopeptide (TPR) repeat protein